MMDATTISISIKRPWQDVYESIWRPEVFLEWASGLASSALRQDGGVWRAEGPDGAKTIHFTNHNSLGVMDHVVETGDGSLIRIPLRVVQNGEGAEVLLTLFRQPDMPEERFRSDAEWVMRDLRALKNMNEAGQGT